MVQTEGCVTQGGKNGNENERMKTKNAHLRRVCVKQGEKKKIMLAERRVWVRTGSFLDQDQA